MGEKFYSVTANEYTLFLADGDVHTSGSTSTPDEELGDFDTLEEAVAARDAWAKANAPETHGEGYNFTVTYHEVFVTLFYSKPEDPDDPDNPDELHAEELEEYTVSTLTGTPAQEKWRECVKRYGYR